MQKHRHRQVKKLNNYYLLICVLKYYAINKRVFEHFIMAIWQLETIRFSKNSLQFLLRL